jgi:hypothetical protein
MNEIWLTRTYKVELSCKNLVSEIQPIEAPSSNGVTDFQVDGARHLTLAS